MSRLGPGWSEDFDVIWDSALGFYRIWVVHLGRRYGLLEALREGSAGSARQLARKLSLSEDAVKLWLEAGLSLGLLERSGAAYSLPRILAPMLADEDDVRFIGGLPSYLALRSLDFEGFDGFFRHGKVPSRQRHAGEAFTAGTIWDHTAFLKLLLKKERGISRLLDGKAMVLDVGSGSGGWSIRLGQRFPGSVFVGVDPDSGAIERGKAMAKALGLRNVRLMVGQVESMKHSRRFDIVYLGEVLSLVPRRRQALLACHRALKKSGTIVVCEGLAVAGDEARDRDNQLAVAMQMDLALQGGRFLSRAALDKLLTGAGFRRVRFYDLGGGLCFLVAQKA